MSDPHICDNTKLCPEGNCHGCRDGKPHETPECSPYCHPVVYRKDTVDTVTFLMIIFLLIIIFVILLVCSIWGIGKQEL